MYVTASKLYDYLKCPHKVWRDVYGPQEEKIKEPNSFVKMLWEKGVQHEKKVVEQFGDYVDLSKGSLEERFGKTVEEIKKGTPLIYQGVLKYENMLGIPDILKRTPDGKYYPLDIKSGLGFEGQNEDSLEEEKKPKPHYAVQLCFYIELLQKLGLPNTNSGKIIDIHQDEVEYDLNQPRGKKSSSTWWDFYFQIKNNVQVLMANEEKNKPAMAGACKLCPWYDSCKKWCRENSDLTNIFNLGRSHRDTLNQELGVESVADVADLDVDLLAGDKRKDKEFLRGIGKPTLKKIKNRAIILSETKKPVLYKNIEFPSVSYELFFDIEDDPTQDFVYMHGVYERNGENERFVDFTAKDKTKEAEKREWGRFWEYIKSLPEGDFAVYYYSPHEKTTYKKMQKLYPDVISAEEVEGFFANPNVIDLYIDIISKYTDWPLGSYSLKDIAQYLGFRWRDETPSGALSIQWFNEYLKTKDNAILERIRLYNEDDCKATMVIKDALEELSLNGG